MVSNCLSLILAILEVLLFAGSAYGKVNKICSTFILRNTVYLNNSTKSSVAPFFRIMNLTMIGKNFADFQEMHSFVCYECVTKCVTKPLNIQTTQFLAQLFPFLMENRFAKTSTQNFLQFTSGFLYLTCSVLWFLFLCRESLEVLFREFP